MHLTFSPQAALPGQPETTLHAEDDVLVVDGVHYDLSSVPEGGEGWPEEGSVHPFVGCIRRIDGVIHAVVRVQLGSSATDNQPDEPAHWVMSDARRDIVIPALRKPETQPEDDQ